MASGEDVVAVPREQQLAEAARLYIPIWPVTPWPGDGPKPNIMFEFTGPTPREPEPERPPPPFRPDD